MSSNAIIQFSFAGLPPSYCFQGFDRFALDIVNNMTGFVPGEYSVIIDSGTEPDAEDRDKLWHKQLPGGAPTGKLYSYYLGKWVTPHPIEASAKMRMWWTGTESELWAFDGGDGSDPSSSAPTATTGAMWSRDTDYDFRFPLAMGTSPAPASTSVVPGDTGGEENHTATDLDHIHVTGRFNADSGSNPDHWYGLVGDGTGPAGLARRVVGATSGLVEADINTQDGKYTLASSPLNGDLTPHEATPQNNMPPYRTGLWAKRSARVYYVA